MVSKPEFANGLFRKINKFFFTCGADLLKYLAALPPRARKNIRCITLNLYGSNWEVHALHMVKTCTNLEVLTLDVALMGLSFHILTISLGHLQCYAKLMEIRGLKLAVLTYGIVMVRWNFFKAVLKEARSVSPMSVQAIEGLKAEIKVLEQELNGVMTKNPRISTTQADLTSAKEFSKVVELPDTILTGPTPLPIDATSTDFLENLD